MSIRILLIVWLFAGVAVRADERPIPQISHVVIVSIDGARPDLILRADAPRLQKLMRDGSFSLWARTTAQSTTLPSHVSMLTGVTPEAHAIMWNGDLPFKEPVWSRRPTLFELAKSAGLTTAMVGGKSKMAALNKPGTIDWCYVPADSVGNNAGVGDQSARLIHDHKPNVLFMHLPDTDTVGHAVGWGTDEQLAAMNRADNAVGQMLDALEEQDLTEKTAIIISADHGGAGRVHGPDDVRSRTIPWIIKGPGIRANYDLTRLRELEVNTFDTFATACWLLAIQVPNKIDGKPIVEILQDRELVQPTTRAASAQSP